MSPRVVGDDAEPAPRERVRAVDDVTAGGREAVREDDRFALAGALAAEDNLAAPDLERRRGLHSANRRYSLLEVVDAVVAQADQRDVAVPDDEVTVDDEDRPAHESTRPR